MSTQKKILLISLLCVVFIGLCAAVILYQRPANVKETIVGYPTSIGGIGDSMSRGFNTAAVNKPAVANNWATGSNPSVNSIAMRIAERSGITPEIHNVAVSGDASKDLEKQVANLNMSKPAFTTFLIGPNDVCISGGKVSGMTSTDTFRTRITAALNGIDPGTAIFVGSVVDLQQLLLIGKDNADTRQVWAKGKVCQVLLAEPLSSDAEDVSRRSAVASRVDEYNTVLKEECGKIQNCTYDDGALHATQFTISDLSSIDYFHPSIKGQSKIAETLWPRIQQMYEQK